MHEQDPSSGHSRCADSDPNPAHRGASVAAARPGDHVGSSLPPRGLTLVQLGTQASGGHWATAVVPLVSDLVSSGQPVFFVESGGLQSYVTGPVLTQVCGDDRRLRVHEDRDLLVRTPPIALGTPGIWRADNTDGHGRRSYRCCIPTLDNIRPDLAAHDDTYGQSVVIFDEAYLLRPYLGAGDPDVGTTPVDMTPAQAAGWRATDLLTFAQARTAPTVLVYDTTQAPELDLQALLSVSTMHIVYSYTPGHDTVDVVSARRRELTEGWRSTRTVVPAVDLSVD